MSNPVTWMAGQLAAKAAGKGAEFLGNSAMDIGNTYVGNVAGNIGSVGLNKQKEMMDFAVKYGIDPQKLAELQGQNSRRANREEQAAGMKGMAFKNRITQDFDRATTVNDLAKASFQNANDNALRLADNYANAYANAQQSAAQMYGSLLR